ncbi:MAG: hypothetical protein AAF393_14540 [Pseudomonadota bacterium]
MKNILLLVFTFAFATFAVDGISSHQGAALAEPGGDGGNFDPEPKKKVKRTAKSKKKKTTFEVYDEYRAKAKKARQHKLARAIQKANSARAEAKRGAARADKDVKTRKSTLKRQKKVLRQLRKRKTFNSNAAARKHLKQVADLEKAIENGPSRINAAEKRGRGHRSNERAAEKQLRSLIKGVKGA